ncbi:thiol-activated cytolysin family protein [Rhodohalobacter sp.]|uniref:thiol-activated cytolysin family protein n=1 Tax=Rhodohalobacter sp. TaxID=1974210 RepID=UPI002ACE75AA|nr:thiol-activated cytolysin family protein [Rhodohalobacter sp.]MDZ7755994.1 thiol-activated cytolysin family protein [Rhodohalobacter sp.]
MGCLKSVPIFVALEWWNANAYEEGYVNAASSSNRITTSYSSTQASLDLGLNVEWATGDVQSQFNFETSEENRVVMATFKQAFYSVTYVQENGAQPEDVFGPSVSLQQVQSAFSSTAPPAYVSSVTYGRIIMFRMETSSSYTSAEVEAAFRYATGAQVEGDLEVTYDEILQNSAVEVITLGGNAAVASEAVTARSAGDLVPIITGDNAVYSRNNPGVPIAYAVKFLKDDQVAKLGYTTEYTATECSAIRTADVVTVDLIEFEVVKDCDVGPGDFDFNATVYYNGEQMFNTGGVGPWIAAELDDGETKSIDEEVVFNAKRQDGNTFAVDFWAREQDNPPLGSPNYNDLNGKKKRTHTYNANTGWSNLNPGSQPVDRDTDGISDLEIELVGDKSNTCRVKLYYDVTLQ